MKVGLKQGRGCGGGRAREEGWCQVTLQQVNMVLDQQKVLVRSVTVQGPAEVLVPQCPHAPVWGGGSRGSPLEVLGEEGQRSKVAGLVRGQR